LNHRRHSETRQEALHAVVCQLAEQKLQPSARSALQSVTHYVHAEQKQAQTADKR